MRSLGGEFRDAWRSLTHSPGTSLVAACALGLGLGAAVFAFGAVDVVLFRQLPIAEPDRVVRLFTVQSRGSAHLAGVSIPYLRAYASDTHAVAALALYRDNVRVDLAAGHEFSEVSSASLVSGNYFSLLGVRPARGRLLGPEDDLQVGAHPVVVLSHSYSRRRFGAREAVGSIVRLNGNAYTIVGVAPASFHGIGLGAAPDLFLPVSMAAQAEPAMRGQFEFMSSAFFQAVGRLAPGATVEQARAEAAVIARRLGAGSPAATGPEADDPDWRVPFPHLVHASDVAGVDSRPLAWGLVAAAGFVLLIATADATNVLLGRCDRRTKDLAIRVSLGANRRGIVRGCLIEGLALSSVAALIGFAFASGIGRVLQVGRDTGSSPAMLVTSPEPVRTVLFAAGVACLVGLAASIVPAWRAFSTDPWPVLRRGNGASDTRRLPLQHLLVVVQIALSVALLSATGLLVRSVAATTRASPVADGRSLLVASLEPARAGYDAARGSVLEQQLLETLERLPGVRVAAIGTSLPFQNAQTTTVQIRGRSERVSLDSVTADYVEALGLPVVRGRAFGPADGATVTVAAMVNEAAADRFWPQQDPIGQIVSNISPRRLSAQIVGVVRARPGEPRDPSRPLLIVPRARFHGVFPFQPRTAIFLRTDLESAGELAPSVAAAVQRLDRELPVIGLRTAEQHVARFFAGERLLAATFSMLAVVALILSSAGLFAVVASTTEARRREIAIRAALGLRPGQVRALVLKRTAALVGGGVLLGLVLALGLGRFLARFLFRVSAYDVSVLAASAIVLFAVGLTAAYGPIRRAVANDPSEVLRME